MRKRICVQGIVQGVGFRPFAYNLAQTCGLAGWVRNAAQGVLIEVEGAASAIDRFVHELRSSAPVLSQIDAVEITDTAPQGASEFLILESEASDSEFVLVPPDIATCEDCRRDFTDRANRRYQYPFTNCTNCGPRYTIIEDIPYDRPATTMSEFIMCPDCSAEYTNPSDRRFHAQPNACPVCGPRLSAMLPDVRRWLRQGRIVAIKGLGGFHLACDAENDGAVRTLRERKRRSDKPFAVMARDITEVERFCVISDAEREALLGPRRPIVIVERRTGTTVSAAIAPGNQTIGVMLPYTPLHHLLFERDEGGRFNALVMTSANLSEEPIVSREDELPRIDRLVDEVLTHDRRIQTRVDDSVVRVFEGRERVARRSRGYAPHPIDLGFPMREALAAGGELKNTFCLTKQHYAILSQHIGDLENYETLEFFRETLDHMKRFFRVTPEVVAHDLHPGYLGTRFALEIPEIEKLGVQHHHAHIASCMAENRLREKVIGVAFDGTGYGTDGQIWGGEFLVCDFKAFERRVHLRYVPMAGGDAAIRQPWRSALSYLRDTFGRHLPEGLLSNVCCHKRAFVDGMLERKINTIMTSSCGRLFDAVASILDVRHETNYEGQAAIELEALADPSEEARYGFDVSGGEIDMRPAFDEIVRAVRTGESANRISGAFHNTLASAIVDTCCRLRASDGISRVCLSGGTFQNMLLLRRTVEGLRSRGLDVFMHSRVPANDGGIALGQAVIAGSL